MTQRYHAPETLSDALALAASSGLSVIGGATDFFPSGGLQAGAEGVIDISRIAEMTSISHGDDASLRIGASVTWTTLARANLPRAFDGLTAAARQVGGVQIQNSGTIGGNLCNASPAADGVPPLLTLDASVELRSADGSRWMPVADFIKGPRQTDLRPGEILVAIHIPPQPENAGSAFIKLGARKYLVISIAMSSALILLDASGRISLARIAVGACSPVAKRLPDLERDLVGLLPHEDDITPSHVSGLTPISDIRADAAYRADAVRHLIKRTIGAAAGGDG